MAKKKTKKKQKNSNYKNQPTCNIKNMLVQAAAKRVKSRNNLPQYTAEINREIQKIIWENQSKSMAQYHQQLVNGGMALSDEKLQSLNVIDMRGCELIRQFQERDTFEQAMQAIQDANPGEMGFYNKIPCFTEGILLTDTYGEDTKFYFKIIEFDQENKKAKLWIQLYKSNPFDKNQYVINAIETMSMEFDKETQQTYATRLSDYSMRELYTMFDPSPMKWTTLQKALWFDMFEKIPPRLKNNTDQPICKHVMQYIMAANFIMGQTRESQDELLVNRGENMKSSNTRSKRANKTQNSQPNQIIHTYNGLKIIYKKQYVQNRSGNRNYVTPVWTTKGHVRKYKSGRIVYIPPTVHHRKALLDKNTSTAAPKSVIRVE